MLSSSQKERSRARSAASSPLSASPGDGPLRTPWLTSRVSDVVCTPTPGAASRLAEEDLWKRPREVGIDEENLRQKDKASLISYITKLETEVIPLFFLLYSVLFARFFCLVLFFFSRFVCEWHHLAVSICFVLVGIWFLVW